MRSVSASLLAAAQNEYSSHGLAKFTLRQSDLPTVTLDDTNAPSWFPSDTWPQVTTYPQAICYADGGVYTIINYGGYLRLYHSSISDDENLCTTGGTALHMDTGSRPGIAYYDNALTVYYVNNADNKIDIATINTTTFLGGVPNNNLCATVTDHSNTDVWSDVALLAVSVTDYNGFMPGVFLTVLAVDGGAIGCTVLIPGQSSAYEPDQRFLVPNRFLGTPGDNAALSLQYSAAVYGDWKLRIYYTNPETFDVFGLGMDITNGVFEEIRVVFPSDLSKFHVANAFYANNTWFIVGAFERTDELATGDITNLCLRSNTGSTFAMDRFSLVSRANYPVQMFVNGTSVYIAYCNAVDSVSAPYVYVGDNTTLKVDVTADQMVSMTADDGNQKSTATVTISDPAETLWNNTNLKKLSQCLFYLGYKTTAGDEYVKYGTYIVTRLERSRDKAARKITLGLTGEGIWRVNTVISPLYTEITGRDFVVDECDEWQNFYTAPGARLAPDTDCDLSVDFFDCRPWDGTSAEPIESGDFNLIENGGPRPSDQVAAHDLYYQTADIKTLCNLDGYPVAVWHPVAAMWLVTIDLYGWSRNINVDEIPDAFDLYAIGVDGDGESVVVSGTLNSTYCKFPITWPDVQSGSNPITYYFDVGEDFVLKSVGVRTVTPNGSTFYPERLEISGVEFSYRVLDPNSGWEIDDGFKASRSGRPYILFSSKPYSAETFELVGHFERSYDSINMYWGFVCFASDAANYLAVRYSEHNTRFELAHAVHGIESSVSLSPAITFTNDVVKLKVTHNGGYFKVLVQEDDGEWQIVWTAKWQSGFALDAGDTKIYHVGIYVHKAAPWFKIAGYSPDDSHAVAMQPLGYGNGGFDAFPSTGVIKIGSSIYNYGSKSHTGVYSTNRGRGPFVGFSTFSGTPAGVEIGLFDWTAADNLCAGFYLATDNQKTWLISSTDWSVMQDPDDGYLRNRSRHYSSQAHDNLVGSKHRVYIAPALEDITVIASETSHSHGDVCVQHDDGYVKVTYFAAVGGRMDANISTLMDDVFEMSGTSAEYLSDTKATYQVDSDDTEYKIRATPYQVPPGVDLLIEDMPPFQADTDYFIVHTNMSFYYPSSSGNQYVSNMYVKFYLSGSYLAIAIGSDTLGAVQYIVTDKPMHVSKTIRAQIFVAEEFCSIYLDDDHKIVFLLPSLEFAESGMYLSMSWHRPYTASPYQATVATVCREQTTWRSAVYIEMCKSFATALSSIIQERPFLIALDSDGKFRVTGYFSGVINDASWGYTTIKTADSYDIDGTLILKDNFVERDIPNAGSHILLVSENGLAGVESDVYLDEDGFRNSMIHLPNLGADAMTVAQIIQARAVGQQKTRTVVLRFDPRVQVGDIIDFGYIPAGATHPFEPSPPGETTENFSGLVENMKVAQGGLMVLTLRNVAKEMEAFNEARAGGCIST